MLEALWNQCTTVVVIPHEKRKGRKRCPITYRLVSPSGSVNDVSSGLEEARSSRTARGIAMDTAHDSRTLLLKIAPVRRCTADLDANVEADKESTRQVASAIIAPKSKIVLVPVGWAVYEYPRTAQSLGSPAQTGRPGTTEVCSRHRIIETEGR